MKKQLSFKNLLFATALGFSCSYSFAQGHWILGGNNATPIVDAINTGNNFLGSAAPNNTFLKFGVNGNQDIFIDNLPGAPQLLPQGAAGRLQGGHWVGLGRVFMPSTGTGNNPLFAPQAHLHIHGGGTSTVAGLGGFTGGLRPWQQTGTLCTENTNGMYCGLKSMFNGATINNESYAVINWSDDASGGFPTDFLSFNFTAKYGSTNATSTDGMELGRFNPTAGQGTFGVGNFQILQPNTIYTDPVRRVEILDADPNTGLNAKAPQLRLTYAYSPNPGVKDIFSEFQTTNLGDLNINTQDNVTKVAPYNDRFNGIHKINPGNTLEINSQLLSPLSNDPLVPASWAGSTGASGLRFTDLNSGSLLATPNAANGIDPTKVLTVDKNGDVVLVNPTPITPGITPTNNGITTLPNSLGGPIIQLGVNCAQLFSQPALLTQAQLTSGRFVFLSTNSLVFGDGPNNTGRVGIGDIANLLNCTGPNNTLEIGSDAASLYPITLPTGFGSSGLRFTHLTSAYTPVPVGTNSVVATKVLTVDGNGDVVLVNPFSGISVNNGVSFSGGNAQLGGLCGNAAAANLLHSSEVPLNNFNMLFSEASGGTGKMGIGTINTACTPGNVLEIGTNASSPYGATNSSGLRFSHLISTSAVVTTNVDPTKVLTVDINGDVVLVNPVASGPATGITAYNGTSNDANTNQVVLGNDVGGTGGVNLGQFVTDREEPMNNKSLIFSDNITPQVPLYGPGRPNTITIGGFYNPYTSLAGTSKLFVANRDVNNNPTEHIAGLFATYFDNTVSNFTILPGIYPLSSAIPFTGNIGHTGAAGYVANLNTTVDYMTGVAGVADNTNPNATGGKYIAGVRGEASGNNATQMAVGVVGFALANSNNNITTNVGGYFAAQNSAGTNYGIYVSAAGSTGNNYAAYFNGYNFNSSGVFVLSDSALKTNIKNVKHALTTINKLNPKTFYFDTTNTVGLNLPSKKQYGFLAQNVQKVLPELTNTFYAPNDTAHSTPYSALNYNGFIGLLTAGMQEQQLSIDSLRNNSSGGLGNICGAKQNPLTNNYEIPLNGYNINYTDTALSTSQIVIGNPSCFHSKARFSVFADNSFVGGLCFNSSTSTDLTNGFVVSDNNNSGHAVGIDVSAQAGPSSNATGIRCNANSASLQNMAINANANNATTNYGIYASASGGTTNYAGYFSGDVVRTGTDNFTSDQKLKQGIDTINNALNTIMQLKPKTFTYQQTAYPSMHLPSGKQYGLIAQDVQTLLPELVNTNIHPAVLDTLGNIVTPAVSYLSLEYQQLTGIMIRAMQQQQAHINHQDSVINQLLNAVNACCSNSSTTGGGGTAARNAVATVSSLDVTLSDKDIVVLNQNVPNPFAEQTLITYNIPQNAGFAQILFYDINGRQIKSVDVTTKGAGQLNVFANDLTNGMYSYTLIVDGKIIDTKKMVKQQ